jgi:DNA-binding transcriptional MerR regulator
MVVLQQEIEPDVTLTIADAAARTGTMVHTLRYYERENLLDAVARNDSGRRRFTGSDLTRIEFIGRLRSTGMPIRGIREYVELIRAGRHTEIDRIRLLEQHRDAVLAHLAETQQHLAAIEKKIANYRGALLS